jgi:hypothetical protein
MYFSIKIGNSTYNTPQYAQNFLSTRALNDIGYRIDLAIETHKESTKSLILAELDNNSSEISQENIQDAKQMVENFFNTM